MQNSISPFKAILDSLQTSEEAETFLREIDFLHDAAFRIGEQDIQHALSSQVRISTKLLLEELFVKENINSTNAEQIAELFTQLKKAIQTCPRLDMTIAFEPTEDIIHAIRSYLLECMPGEHILISIKTQPELIAGCTLTFEGKYRDYSLTKQYLMAIEKVMGTPQT